MKKYITLFLFLVSFFINGAVIAQDTAVSVSNQENSPDWVRMMDDPKTNYYDALKAYDTYWLTHTKPVLEEEEEMENGGDFGEMKREIKKEQKKDKSVVLTEEQWKKKNEDEVMKYNVKRFERWVRDVKPFVQENGRILTNEERMQIWEKQQEEIKNQKN